MRKTVILALLSAFLALPALAAKETVTLQNLNEGGINPLETLPRKSWLTEAWCACSGQWDPAPAFQLVNAKTGEAYAEGYCVDGQQPAYNSLEQIKPKRKVPRGTHLAVQVANAPRPLRSTGSTQAVCTATIKRRTGP